MKLLLVALTAALLLGASGAATAGGIEVCVNANATISLLLDAVSEGPPFTGLTPAAIINAALC